MHIAKSVDCWQKASQSIWLDLRSHPASAADHYPVSLISATPWHCLWEENTQQRLCEKRQLLSPPALSVALVHLLSTLEQLLCEDAVLLAGDAQL